MLKNYICLGLALVVFILSFFVMDTYKNVNEFLIPLAIGMLLSTFLINAGFNKRAFDERKYKRIIREKNNEIKTLKILHEHAAQAADDFFKQIQAQGK